MSADGAAFTGKPAATNIPATQSPVILSVAFPYSPVGGGAVGGAEVVLSQLEEALPALGFRSLVVAHAASQPCGWLYPTTVPAGEITESVRGEVERSQQAAIDRALAAHPVALVHMHGLDFHRYHIPAHLPVLVTLHLPPAWYPETIWNTPANVHLVCVSETQRQACPAAVRDRLQVVPNGVPLPSFSCLRPQGRYALMLARICAEKNLHTGLDAARRAGMPAMLGGEVFPYKAHRQYFAEVIEPRLTNAGTDHQRRAEATASTAAEARFLGAVTGAAKARLLARAACLLLPSLAPETSSLVAMEALAAGVPVIAMASGAVPEIVEDGRTGFLLDPRLGSGAEAAEAMADAIARLPEIDRAVCRAVAEERFGLHRMIDAYADLYRRYALPESQANTAWETSSAASFAETLQGHSSELASIEPLTSAEQLAALLPAWTRLWEADRRATPFQHPAWLLPWWRQFGPEGELHTLALRGTDGDLLGLLPLYTYREPHTGERKLLLLGAGTSDYLDGVFSGAAAAIGHAQKALAFALQELGCWDSLSLMQLRTCSPLLTAARAQPLQDGLQISEAEPCSLLDIDCELPPKVRANIGRYRRRAAAQGQLACTVAQSVPEALESFDHLQRLQRERWRDRGEAGVLEDERVVAHHREAIPALLAAGLLRFFRLTLDGRLLGVLYALADPPSHARRSLYLYLIGFDVRFARLSPGTLLLAEVWHHAQTEGFAVLDLLRGGESYKQLWGAQPSTTFTLHARAAEEL